MDSDDKASSFAMSYCILQSSARFDCSGTSGHYGIFFSRFGFLGNSAIEPFMKGEIAVDILEFSILDSTVKNWIVASVTALIVLSGLIVIKRILRKFVVGLARKMKVETGDLVEGIFQRTKFYFFLALALYFASHALNLTASFASTLNSTVFIVILIQISIWSVWIVSFFSQREIGLRKEKDPAVVSVLGLGSFILKTGIWAIIVLLALDNLGIDVTALVAGLGVGGIAVALAVQNILKDLFASLSIILDKPFVIGDFIILGDDLGTVERIGLKTTQIRRLTGEQLVMSNAQLLESRIRNFKRMERRRVIFTIGVTYQTAHEKLKNIPGMIKKIIESQEKVEFDRVHFKEYGNFSLNFEAVYWVLDPDYNVYMNINQTINLLIFEQFDNEKIEFAYPTQTIFLDRSSESVASGTQN